LGSFSGLFTLYHAISESSAYRCLPDDEAV
jgi:hypothetical protein